MIYIFAVYTHSYICFVSKDTINPSSHQLMASSKRFIFTQELAPDKKGKCQLLINEMNALSSNLTFVKQLIVCLFYLDYPQNHCLAFFIQ